MWIKGLCLLVLSMLLMACQKMEEPSAFGTLERDRITLLATDSEIIVVQAVEKGTRVKAGDLLLQLDPTRQQARVDQVKADVERLNAALLEFQHGNRQEQIASAAARVDAAEANLRDAEKQFARFTSLREKGMIAAADLDQARTRNDQAKAQLADYRQQWLEMQSGARQETIQQAEASLKSAQAVLAQEQKRLDDLSLRATRDGILEDFPWQLGERVPAGAVAAILVADSQPYARLFIPQPSLTHYQLGQMVEIFVDGRTEPLSGQIRLISQQASFTPHFALHQLERTRLMYVTEVVLEDARHLPTGIPVRMRLP